MAKFKPVTEVKPAEVESKESESPAVIVKSADVQKTIVCLGGYNHAVAQAGDTLEIPTAGLPKDFTMDGVVEGYFPEAVKRRFTVTESSRDEKTLRVKIAPPT